MEVIFEIYAKFGPCEYYTVPPKWSSMCLAINTCSPSEQCGRMPGTGGRRIKSDPKFEVSVESYPLRYFVGIVGHRNQGLLVLLSCFFENRGLAKLIFFVFELVIWEYVCAYVVCGASLYMHVCACAYAVCVARKCGMCRCVKRKSHNVT